MTLLASIRIALRALSINRLRSALTVLGMVIGVAAVITMVAVGSGARARVAEQIQSLGSGLIIVVPGSVQSGAVRLGAGTQSTITDDDAVAIAEEVPGVAAAAPWVRGSVQVIAGNLNWSTSLQGVTASYFDAREWAIADGRALTDEDSQSGTKAAVLGRTAADALFGGADPIGQPIRIRQTPFTVVGVLARKGQTGFGQDQDDTVLVPLGTARTRVLGQNLANAHAVQGITVKAASTDGVSAVESQVRDLLRQRHHLAPNAEDDFDIRNLSEMLSLQQQAYDVLALLLASIASVSLVVGGIGIMNIMLVSVTERTREIGLRMAVGARGRDILTQFLVEALVLSVAGGLAGILIGVGASAVVGRLAGWRTVIEPVAVILAVGVSGAVGVFFGFYPARRASRLDPIAALRYE